MSKYEKKCLRDEKNSFLKHISSWRKHRLILEAVFSLVGMKKRDGKKEHEENELEKIFNLYKKLVEWIINEQLGYLWYVYCFINKIKTQDVVLSKKCVIKIT